MENQQEKPEEEKQPLKEISDEELERVISEHEKWVESEGKEGKCAFLVAKNLKGRNFYGRNLKQANFHGSDLSVADFGSTNLRETILIRANLEETKLYEANLQKANLFDANLKKSILIDADLNNADLEKANFQGAYLTGIKRLYNAKLLNSNFEGANGLLGNEFARANITGAKLPEDIREFMVLDIIAENSKNARKIFLALLLACVYSWLTIGTTTDVNLITNSASSPLPVIGTAIPIAYYYLCAPFLLFGLYLYFHLYLQRLWKGLAGLPAIFEDGKPLDERAYPWLLNGLVRRHFEKLRDRRTFISHLEEGVSIILAWWVVPLTLCWFWLRYIPRHEWAGTYMHIGLITLSILSGIVFYRAHAKTLRGEKHLFMEFKKLLRSKISQIIVVSFMLKKFVWFYIKFKKLLHSRILQVAIVFLTPAVLILLSSESINGVRDKGIPRLFNLFGYDVFADLVGEDISTKPDNYWLIDPQYRDSTIIGAHLKGCDLRQANASGAFFAKADLREANLQGSNLRRARLQDAKLNIAKLQKADLTAANLNGVNLKGVKLHGTCFQLANMQGVQLVGFNTIADSSDKTTSFRNANLQGAIISHNNLRYLDFSRANIKGADLRHTNISQEQLDQACGDNLTQLPDDLTIRLCEEED